jgi:hypothetical protein
VLKAAQRDLASIGVKTAPIASFASIASTNGLFS